MKRKITMLMTVICLSAYSAISQEVIKQKTINVSGTAQMEVVPDEIYVQVELREYDKKGGGKVEIDSG